MIDFDLHTHTLWSHGTGTITENAAEAARKGMKGIAITDHGFSHPAFGMRRRHLDEMRAECIAASESEGVEVLLGVESNLRGADGTLDVKPKDYPKLDVILAGIHRFIIYKYFTDLTRLLGQNIFYSVTGLKPTDKLIKYNTKCYVNAIKNNPVDVITHVGYLCFCDPVEVAKAAADYGTLIEINTKKTHLSDEEWRKVIDTGVNFVVDSDAHSVDRVGDDALFLELEKRVDFPRERIMNIDGRFPDLRFARYKKEHGIETV